MILPKDSEHIPCVSVKSIPNIIRIYNTNNLVANIMASESQYCLTKTSRDRKSKTSTYNLDFDGDDDFDDETCGYTTRDIQVGGRQGQPTISA